GSTLDSQLLDQSDDQDDEYDQEELHDDDVLDELGGQSHLQQPAPCQKIHAPSYRFNEPFSRQIETARR
ncbi:MAG TPA: hypothetical protein PKD64_18900, partial [Pirellulaceae bacterium]|nr:hypothetical protein [Pirellulaceae bacterium]HMO94259.1 hypothetical protein [Pirellulaceae bacterium]